MLKKCAQAIDKVGKWSGEIIAPLALVYMAILTFEIVARYFLMHRPNGLTKLAPSSLVPNSCWAVHTASGVAPWSTWRYFTIGCH